MDPKKEKECPSTLKGALMRRRQQMMASQQGAKQVPAENQHLEPAKTAAAKKSKWDDPDLDKLPKGGNFDKKAELEKGACCGLGMPDSDWRLKGFVNTPFLERAQALAQEIRKADDKSDLAMRMAEQPRRELQMELDRLAIEKDQWLEAQKAQLVGGGIPAAAPPIQGAPMVAPPTQPPAPAQIPVG